MREQKSPARAGERTPVRPRGRPRRQIDMEEVAAAVARLVAHAGYEAVSIERVARELSVSRATLYRTIPSKEHLLGVLFESMTTELLDAARGVMADERASARHRLRELLRLQIDAAVKTRHYLFVFFGRGSLPDEVYARWHRFRHEYELLWNRAVAQAMEAGELPEDDPVVTTRLLLGMCIWVARWYRPEQGRPTAELAESALRLLGWDGLRLSARTSAAADPGAGASTSSSGRRCA